MYESIDTRPLGGLRRPDGGITEGQRPQRTKRRRNAIVASSMSLSGWRVLDIGCAEGITALYMAESAREVVGLDHRASVIESATATAQLIGASNARFVCLDIRDPESLLELGSFDLVTAWGLLHRISDVFGLLEIVAALAPRVSLEWRAPIFPGLSRVAFAHHPSTPDLDPTNLRLQSSEQKLESSSGFWEPSVGAISSIGRAFGFDQLRVLGYGEAMSSAPMQNVRSLARQALNTVRRGKRPQFPVARVHAGLSQAGDQFFDGVKLDPARIPKWDTLVATR
jgi:SAM-dependent methyltransferase